MQMVRTRIDFFFMGYHSTLFEPFLRKYFLIHWERENVDQPFGNWHVSDRWTRDNDMAWEDSIAKGSAPSPGQGVRVAAPGAGSPREDVNGLSHFPYGEDVNEKPGLISPFAGPGIERDGKDTKY
jgi:hypothetical protein